MTARKPGRHALAFVMLTMLIDSLGLGLIVPILPQLLMDLTGKGLGEAAGYGGLLMFLYALMQFVFAPIMGNLSDAYGRRPVLVLSLSVLALDYLIMALAPSFAFLVAGRVLSGAAGAAYGTANAYVADISEPQHRARRFGLLGAAWGLGFTLGPALGGLLGEVGTRLPFYAAAGLAAANALYGLLVLPETLKTEDRRPFRLARANPLGALMQMRRYPVVFALLGAVILYQIAHDANPSVWSFYTYYKFGWSEREVGLSIALVGIATTAVMGGLTQYAIPRLGEARSVAVGFVMGAVGFLGYAFAPTGAVMVAFIPAAAFFGLAVPAFRGILSNAVPANAQGELMGAMASLQGITMIFSPLIMTQLFGAFTGPDAPAEFPGAPFLLAALCLVGALLIVQAALRAPRAETPAAGG